ncbi:hypothetical protein AAHE18_07G137000 [Arachis hypogaea]
MGVEPGESKEAGVNDHTRAFGLIGSETENYNELTETGRMALGRSCWQPQCNLGGATGGEDMSHHRTRVGLFLEKWAEHPRENGTTYALEQGSIKPGKAQMATMEDEGQPSQSSRDAASTTL